MQTEPLTLEAEGRWEMPQANLPKVLSRIHRIRPTGEMALFPSQRNGPVNDILWHEGRLDISHHGKTSAVEPGRALSGEPLRPRDFARVTATGSGTGSNSPFKTGWSFTGSGGSR